MYIIMLWCPKWNLKKNLFFVHFYYLHTLAFFTFQISTLKSKIQDATNLPSGKQKLVYEVKNLTFHIKITRWLILQGIFVKDSQSLASYNFQNGSVVQLQLKERGGRKKWLVSFGILFSFLLHISHGVSVINFVINGLFLL